MDYRIKKIVALINMDLAANLLCEELATSVNLSNSRLRHLFKQETGIPLNQYIRLQRLEKSRQLLEQTNLNVKEICYKVGVLDCSHFVRDFERKFGLTPSRYRIEFQSKQGETRIREENINMAEILMAYRTSSINTAS